MKKFKSFFAHLYFATHADKGHERRVLLNILEQHNVPVLAGQVLRFPHEENVPAARLLSLRAPPLLHLALMLVERLDTVEGGVVGQGTVGVALERPTVELAQLDRPHVSGHKGGGELDRGGGVLQKGAAGGALHARIRNYFKNWQETNI